MVAFKSGFMNIDKPVLVIWMLINTRQTDSGYPLESFAERQFIIDLAL
jgi:hypothetical protein